MGAASAASAGVRRGEERDRLSGGASGASPPGPPSGTEGWGASGGADPLRHRQPAHRRAQRRQAGGSAGALPAGQSGRGGGAALRPAGRPAGSGQPHGGGGAPLDGGGPGCGGGPERQIRRRLLSLFPTARLSRRGRALHGLGAQAGRSGGAGALGPPSGLCPPGLQREPGNAP